MRHPRIIKRMFLVALSTVCIASLLSACAGGGSKRGAQSSIKFMQSHDLKKLPRFDIPIPAHLNDRVIGWMEYFNDKGRGSFQRYLERYARYAPLIQQILKEEGVPQDLIYIALIESGFNTRAVSSASAVGPWQFIRSTGALYGLDITAWEDERSDPYKSTRAAARYLKDLYSEFGDWYLAMASYNGGPGRVKRAIAATGSRDFWEIADNRGALHPETQNYVPKYIAAAIMAKVPERFGFKNLNYKKPFEYDTVTVDSQTDLSVVAKCADVTEEEIFDLNPHLTRGTTPPVSNDYVVRIPKGKSSIYKRQYALLPKQDRVTTVHYKVRRGDTMQSIAAQYGVESGKLALVNRLKERDRLRPGRVLVLPVGAEWAKKSVGRNSDLASNSASTKKVLWHRVRKGESIGAIAKRYKVTVAQINEWNRIGKKEKLTSGKNLRIFKYVAQAGSAKVASKDPIAAQTSDLDAAAAVEAVVAEAEVHEVRSGETLGSIAKKNGITVRQLMALNDMNVSQRLLPGMKLLVKQAKKGASVPKQDTSSKPQAHANVSQRSQSKAPLQLASAANVVKSGEEISLAAASAKRPVASLSDAADLPGLEAESVDNEDQSTDDTAPEPEKEDLSAPAKKSLAQASDLPVRSDLQKKEKTSQYAVKKGETLQGIANRNDVTLKELMAWNKIKDAKLIREGMKLTIRAANNKVAVVANDKIASPVREVEGSKYKVLAGETLGGIANRNGVTTKQLMEWNGITNPASVRVGAELKLKGDRKGETVAVKSKNPSTNPKGGLVSPDVAPKTQPVPDAVAVANDNAAKRSVTANAVAYQVKNGDTLWDIARRHNVSIAQIQKWNNLSDPSAVKPGSTIKILGK